MPSPGARLGPYEILSTIGAGGMGEVYRARDSRIGREVAVKILPAHFSEHVERLRRFEQEARAAGTLNHPNILSLYDVGTENGTPYFVTELLQGETLRRKLLDGPIGVRKTMEYALQIAHGLSSAHEKGITHRDLKPENLFLIKEGRVKILDFGLAKLTHPEISGSQFTSADTVTHQTEPGEVLGTIVYMSPEQVRGMKVDYRSDIFAFGSILYEMLSGKRPFQGESNVEVMHAILKSDPPDLLQSNSNVPPALEKIVRRCMEKDPDLRFQSTSDLAFALEALSSASGTIEQTSAKISSTNYTKYFGGFAILALLFYGATKIATIKRKPVASAPVSTSSFLPYSWNRVTFRRGYVSSAAFSSDGQTILYKGEWIRSWLGEIYFSRIGSPEARTIGAKDAEILSVSSNGELAILMRNEKYPTIGPSILARMPFAGGVPRQVVTGVQDADWSPDGKELAIIRNRSIEFPIGKALYSSNHYPTTVRVSPKGDLIAFIEMRVPGIGTVMAVDLNGKVRKLYETDMSTGQSGSMGLAFSATGDEIWFGSRPKKGTGQVLCAVDLSGRFREVLKMNGHFRLFDISGDGKILLARGETRSGMNYYSETEGKERDVSWLSGSLLVDISNDGRYLLFVENADRPGDQHRAVYLRDVQASDAIRLGDGWAWDLSPDNQWVLAFLEGSIILLPTAAGEIKTLSKGWKEGSGGFFPDGKRILFYGLKEGHKERIYVQNIEGGEPKPVSPEGVYLESPAANVVAPDGSHFYAYDDVYGYRIYSIDGGEPREIKGMESGDYSMAWSPDGLYLYVEKGVPSRIFKLDPSTGRREFWKEFMVPDAVGVHGILPVFTPDRKAQAYSYTRTLSDLYVIEGLK